MNFNKYQTPITDELLATLPKEVQDQLIEALVSIEFIQRLVSPNRQYAKDRPRDESGKIIVDLSNPHILENMDYFRPTALHYEQYGTLTDLKPNSNPNSAYGKWIKEEKRRCWEGFIRPSDGEWVTGYMYWYLNYCPIMLSRIRKGSKRADRIEAMPEVWEGIYWRFHYIDQASNAGKHCAELASRSKSKSYTLASILSHLFILGENVQAHEKVTGIVTAYQKEFLTKDGVLNKFVDMINFCASHTQFPRKRLKDSLQEMTWTMGYRDAELGIERGTQNTVLGVSSKDDESKLRGKRAAKILVEEMGTFARLLDLYNILLPSVQEGDIVFGQIIAVGTAGDKDSDFAGAKELMYNPDGYNMYALPNVYDKNNQGKSKFTFFFPGYINRKGCYNEDGVSDVTKALIEILLNRYRVKYNSSDPSTIIKTIAEVPITPAEAVIRTGVNMFPVADLTERLVQIDNNPAFFDDVYVGDLIIEKDGGIRFKPTSDKPIRDFPHKDNKILGAIEIFEMPEIEKSSRKVYSNRYISGCLVEGEKVNTQRGLIPVEEVTLKDRLINIEGQSVEIYNLQKYYNESPVYKVKLSNIIDTTTFSEEHPIYCCTKKVHYHPSYYAQKHNLPYRYFTYNYNFKPVKDLKVGDYVRAPILYTEEKDISSLWVENRRIDYQTENPLIYPEFWYLVGVILGDGWVSSKWNVAICFNKKEAWLIQRCRYIVERFLHRKFTLEKNLKSVYEYSFCCKPFIEFFTKYFGKYAAGKYIAEPIKYMPYECKKHLILGYIDTDGCYSYRRRITEIVSVSKKLLCDIQDILFSIGIISSVKLLRPSGEHAIVGKKHQCKSTYSLSIALIGTKTMQDWNIPCMKISNCKLDIKDASHDILNVFIKDGYLNIKVKKIDVLPYNGPIYNFECATHTFMCNYIPTHNCDPIDQDESNTMSLGSIFILDLWTDKIVAEYTGRPIFAEDFHEICRKLCLFYNARLNYENNLKGLFSYFSTHNCLYLLTDTLEFLKDKQMIKESYGNLAKGTRATAPINNYARERLRSWLLSPVKVAQVIDGEEQETTIPRLATLRNRALIKELINYNSLGNFDRISAMGMLMLLREDRMILYQGNLSGQSKVSPSYLGNDDFFAKNYIT